MHDHMMQDYLCDTSVNGPALFRRCYRMRRFLLLHIISRVYARDSYFVQKRDACRFLGLSLHQKITSALRMLCYGVSGDAIDEYCRTSESIATESLKQFYLTLQVEFEVHHLRQPRRDDFLKQLVVATKCGFPGMFASLDCMHYKWKNCPVAWQGDFGDWSS